MQGIYKGYMTSTTQHPNQDRPIRRNRDDKLDRGPFVASLVRTLVRDSRDAQGNLIGRSSSGFVVGLTGKWGSGKSSILSLVQAELGTMDRVIVSYFNPWLFNGRDELVRGFFSGLRDDMGRSTREHGRDLAEALERYWGAIDLAGHAVAAVADLHGAGGAATTGWGLWSKRTKDAIAKPEARSPEEERRFLEKKITTAKVAVVVLIDELDRVEDDEVRAVAQLIKAVGDIEGVSYLVAYDPDRVADALGRGVGQDRLTSGARYLEKIVQLPIPLRPLFEADVDALLKAELETYGVSLPDEQRENQRAIFDQIKREVTTPRDIKRLVGAFAVLEQATRGEIEPVDVLAYSWILTKAPDLREAIMVHFDGIVSDVTDRTLIADLMRRHSNNQRPPLPSEILGECALAHHDLLLLLFPNFREDQNATGNDGNRLDRRRNMVRLLYLGNPPGAVARKDIERIWQMRDAAEMEAALRALMEAGELTAFLDRMDDLIAQLPANGDTLFWPVLSRALTRSRDWMTSPGPEYALVDDAAAMLTHLAIRDRKQESRVKAAVDALIASGDLAITPTILRKQLYVNGRYGQELVNNDVLYTKSEAIDLLQREIPRYRDAVLDGTALRRLPNLEVIYTLANNEYWGNDLRDSLTHQLDGRDALATMAALIYPPGYGSSYASVSQLFDPVPVTKALGEADFTTPPLQPWIDNAVGQLRATLAGPDDS
ncbi:NTPase [Novosphingobium barchaimii LL02]|uniref:NTPase n=1 Tax=Novosphingobium barchaimii LL02 TaxID=1114963 RepID=A0A0J7XR63_9SPHN|nr:KAP family NTPase [Novosphingobium barchaimii]KMS53528.1 NTPase [Novosphingobium barchaimii LL02]